jgi:hypothetical protein
MLVEHQPQEKKFMKLLLAVVLPVISQLTPASANAGAPAFMLEVDGSKFGGQATVNFGATKINPTFVNSGKLQAMVPATAVAAAGTVHVTVTNPGTPGGLYGGGTQPETSVAMDFTVN